MPRLDLMSKLTEVDVRLIRMGIQEHRMLYSERRGQLIQYDNFPIMLYQLEELLEIYWMYKELCK